MVEPVVAVVGSRRVCDYVGARSLYLFRTLEDAGVRTRVIDWKSRTPDPLPGTTHVFFLPWAQYIDADIAEWCRSLCQSRDNRVVWTEEAWWWNECRTRAAGSWGDPEDVFGLVAFSTPDGTGAAPRGSARRAVWPPLVHRGSVPKLVERPQRKIFVDAVWPDEWASGVWNAIDVVDATLPALRDELGVSVVAAAGKTPVREWVDETVPEGTDLDEFLERVSECACFVATHHESLGLSLCEAQTLGVPVVCADEHACSSVREPRGLFSWRNGAEKKTRDESEKFSEKSVGETREFSDSERDPAALFASALRAAVEFGSDAGERKALSARAEETFGGARFIETALAPLFWSTDKARV